ncbi:MAG: stage II sporulation protein M [Acidobacteria bacterium]|nr:stage II sporulation protein M [Acidobacteriota bacterium]
MRNLTRDEVRELGRIYRRTASDLAIARVESRDQRLVSYLNNLVIRAHGMIYRTEKSHPRAILDFFLKDYPLIFRQTSRYTLATFLIFMAISLCSFIATWRKDEFADFAYVGPGTVQMIKNHHSWWEVLNKEAPVGSASIMANNIWISLKTFAMSIIPVAGTVDVLMPSALMFGSINALILKYKMSLKLWSFMIGHGVPEFLAIFISGGAGLMIGMAVLIPGERTRREALVERGSQAIKLMAGAIPLLVIAGLIEGFISPLPIHYGYKFGVATAMAVALTAYLMKRN